MKSTRDLNWARLLFVSGAMIALVTFCLCVASPAALAQNAGTGAIAGTITDPTEKAVLGAQITVTNQATGAKVTVPSQSGGTYTVPLLLPGLYTVEVSKDGFKSSVAKDIRVNVTETEGLNIKLELGSMSQTIVVQAEASVMQTESSTEGHTTGAETIQNLPLATRNYTQIIGLNPNIATGVTNATTLGRGDDIYDAGVSANGVPTNDNNTLMDGVQINDRQLSGQFSGGVAIPNPDSISEFRVQTSQYDASFGRDAGANVNLVTKGGSNQIHGNLWEYFRDTNMNANDFFLKRSEILSGQPNTPPVLNQNQFGGALGGPIKKDKLFFFTSYQGTRSKNGFSGSCLTTINGIGGLTDTDRTAAGLGAAFVGQTGAFGGEAILANGSNISQQAIHLLNIKLANGQFLIPSPPAGQSSLVVTNPCPFNEDQFVTDVDYVQSSKSRFSARFFFADDLTTETHPAGGAVSGTPYNITANYRNFSLMHDYAFSSRLLNQAQLGFHRTYTNAESSSPFTLSSLGANVPSFDNNFPIILSASGFSIFAAPGAVGQDLIAQDTYDFQDSLSYTIGKHTLRFGGGVDHLHENRNLITGDLSEVFGLPDLLLGACGAPITTLCPGTGTSSVPAIFGNGSPVSNIIASEDFPPGFDTQELISWDFNAYAQDDFKVTPRLTLNLGFRYDRNGYQGDALGKNVGFDPSRITPFSVPGTSCTTPNGTGTLLGYTVSSNFTGTPPCEVVKLNSESGFNPGGNNTWNPRVGFAWRLPHTERVVLRGGYGIYHSILTGQPQLNTTEGQPFFSVRVLEAFGNSAASLGQPFQPSTTIFPSYTPYTSASTQSVLAFEPNIRVPMIQEYSLNVQMELAKDLVLEIGYSGSRGEHLFDQRSVNQACVIGAPGNDACPASLPSGATTNTAANVQMRVPYEGITSADLLLFQSDASYWYNALVASLTKRMGHGLQFQLSYTWNKEMETFAGSNGASVSSGPNGAVVNGDQNNPLYGPDGSIRPQRFVASYVYSLPGPKNLRSVEGEFLGGWQLAGVTTYQAGPFLTILNNANAANIYGDTGPGAVTASLAAGCTVGQLDNPGTIQSKLGIGGAINYFNTACLTTPAASPFGTGTGFGNLGAGIVRGPDQANWDMSLSKRFCIPWPNETANLVFRADFFNLFNHTQFSNPGTTFGSPTLGEITSTSVNPRIIQLALRFTF